MNVSDLLNQPIFFESNRVWRCYTGGLLLDRFYGCATADDGHFPEDWLASTTLALNGPKQQHPDEGLSRIRLPDGSEGPLFRDAISGQARACLGPGAVWGKEGVGVLCKFLDSAVRLPIQCHPDREFARRHYNSEHGKAEAWLILGTRKVVGEDPYLLMGFKPWLRKESFVEAVREQDVEALTAALHRFPVSADEAYFIPGRFPHAIGPGVFMLEVQEPTDWVVQPERKVGDFELSDADMWGPLAPEVGLECFDFNGGATAREILGRVRLSPRILREWDGARLERIVGSDTTDCFCVDRLTVRSELDFAPRFSCHIAVVTAGEGRMIAAASTHAIRQGDVFFVPHSVRQLRYETSHPPLTVYAIAHNSSS